MPRRKPETMTLKIRLDSKEALAKMRDLKSLAIEINRRLDGAAKTSKLVQQYAARMEKLETIACLRGKAERMRRIVEWVAGLSKKDAHKAPARARKMLQDEADHELRNLNQ